MIDKLDLRIPARTSLTPEFRSVLPTLPFRDSRHYKFTADLRQFLLNGILHYGCRHGEERNHKLELIDTGVMTLADISKCIQRLFLVNPDTLSIMRLDLAVDVKGIGVPWFAERARVRFKRFLSQLGVIDSIVMGNREIQTLYFGKRPNLIRIYDKLEEHRVQYRRILRSTSSESTPPSFEERFGMPEFGHILTRVERQMGGGRIPVELETVAHLRDCAAFNPFESVEFITGGTPEPHPNDYSFMEYSTGMHLRHLAETQGMQAAMSYITRHSKRNKKWALKKFRDFLPVPSNDDLNSQRLFELYQRSIASQFQGHRAA